MYGWYELIQHVRQESDLAGALDRLGQLALMHGAGTGGAAGQDLAGEPGAESGWREIVSQAEDIVLMLYFVYREKK